jgi:carboxyl-terminal processing protease
MRKKSLLRTLGLVAASFAGGAFASHLASATPSRESPYAPFDQLARVMVLVENQYVEPAQRAKIIDGAIKGMVAELDPHSAYMPPSEYALFQGETEGKFAGVGLEVDFKNDYVTVLAPIEGSPAARVGIKPGDQIVAIDGKPMRGERIDKMVALMRGPSGTTVHMTVRRAGVLEPLVFDLTREEIHVPSVTGKRLDHDVAYLKVKQFQEGTHEEFLRVTARLREESKAPLTGVVLDLRNNPGGLVDEAEALADELMSSGIIYTTRHRGQIVDEVKAHDGGAFASVPIVALVNEYSASSAELVAGALQDSRRASIVGQTTFGKGSVQTIFDLPGGAGMRLTTMRYYTPGGRSIQAEGIKPDVQIEGAKTADGEVVRERDLEGHLPAEPGGQQPKSGPAPKVLVDPNAKPPSALESAQAEVPKDPSKGADFALSVGYQLLLKNVADKR